MGGKMPAGSINPAASLKDVLGVVLSDDAAAIVESAAAELELAADQAGAAWEASKAELDALEPGSSRAKIKAREVAELQSAFDAAKSDYATTAKKIAQGEMHLAAAERALMSGKAKKVAPYEQALSEAQADVRRAQGGPLVGPPGTLDQREAAQEVAIQAERDLQKAREWASTPLTAQEKADRVTAQVEKHEARIAADEAAFKRSLEPDATEAERMLGAEASRALVDRRALVERPRVRAS